MPVLRPRKQPERTCVSCRETQAKRALVRLRAGAGVTLEPLRSPAE